MKEFYKNGMLNNPPLPVDIVLHPSWWFYNEGITFDKDYYFNPAKRVEVEQRMEKALYERWGRYGLGKGCKKERPVIGALHLAAGFMVSGMLGCRVEYLEDSAPQVITADTDTLNINAEGAFKSDIYKDYENLADRLKSKYGYIEGDINWSGVLNIALDLRGERIFLDMFDKPGEVDKYFNGIAHVLDRFTQSIKKETGSYSVSVNRNVRNIPEPVFLHSECSHTMISVQDYERFLLRYDVEWSNKCRPFGIHYCGADPHRYAESFAKVPHLDFLDIGWGGDVKLLRQKLPNTFFNIRLSPVEIINESTDEIKNMIIKLAEESENPWLTGVCCINMDHHVSDDKITAIFETVEGLKRELNIPS
ncbi:MAG: hypothetical protein GXP33_16250 [Spirochaetes bacterium]|nr:hypothetical protein [Spirochaetota bacterium]